MFGGQKSVILFNEEEYSEKKFEGINARLNEIGWRAQYASALTNPSTRFFNAVISALWRAIVSARSRFESASITAHSLRLFSLPRSSAASLMLVIAL